MRLQPRQKFEVVDDYEILASYDVIREVTNGFVIDASTVTADGTGKKIVKKGMPMGRLANGKYGPYDSAATDGRQNPSVILKHTYDVTEGDNLAAGYEMAKVITERIPVTVDATLRSKMPQIVFG